MEILTKAEQLKNELDTLRPLDGEREARIMQKFRLDWNYHSNNLEGNSLTYGETKALILFGITAQGKPLKDHFEITGHNEAINWILEIVKDEMPLNEKFIRELHTLLLKESSYKEALTPDGKPTRRKIEVGKYKSQPNHVITVTGETFYFATPEETPAKMHDLIEWFRKEKDKSDINPIILSALFHYRFIRIHPFDDGNGRVARILMNFILMQFGYPPVIIKTEDKENYYAVLRLADADELEPFIEYIAQNLVRSLEIMIKGAKGENIEEPDDLDKELALLERNIRSIGKKIEIQKDKSVVLNIFDNSVTPLTNEFFIQFRVFDKFYLENHARIILNNKAVLGEYDNAPHYARKELEESQNANFSEIEIVYSSNYFNQDGFGNFSYESKLVVYLEQTGYKISDKERKLISEKLYSEQLSVEEIQSIVSREKRNHLEFIQNQYERATRKT
jgi:Fic family protein